MSESVKVGVIGTGAISGAYLGMAKNFPIVEIAACADMNLDAARKKAEEFAIPKVCTVEELLADPSIEIILNLTVPKAHVPIGLAASNGKPRRRETLASRAKEGAHLIRCEGEKLRLLRARTFWAPH